MRDHMFEAMNIWKGVCAWGHFEIKDAPIADGLPDVLLSLLHIYAINAPISYVYLRSNYSS
jgi:hypothetical protein